MSAKSDSHPEPSPEEAPNDRAPGKGTNEPWKRPGQTSQNPDHPEPGKPDLEKWQDSSTH